ncbi:MAG: CRISPR-associated endonuclease Cas2 [Candidatus Eisenbacteria bacterium]|nr:CRISPR-associated endonuclease Cas2 [Candidatus Eisenbacteria bacterium]
MTRAADYAVVYDISSDRERAKVDKLLKGFGFRIQKSVFECRLTKGGRKELIEKLERLKIKTGFVKVYRVEYTTGADVVGEKKGPAIDEGNAYIV